MPKACQKVAPSRGRKAEDKGQPDQAELRRLTSSPPSKSCASSKYPISNRPAGNRRNNASNSPRTYSTRSGVACSPGNQSAAFPRML